MDTYAERLRHALNVRGISQTELARQIGVKPQAVQYLVTKGSGSKHSSEIARILRIRVEWLTKGRGIMEEARHANVRNAAPPGRALPIISSVQAGNWAEAIDTHEPGDAEQWHPAPPGIRCSDSSFWLEVEGRSMVSTTVGRTYPPGSLVLVDPEKRDAATGDLVIAKLAETGEVTFKQFNREGDRLFLEPLNTQYPVIEINSETQIIGTVLSAVVNT